MKSIHLIFDGSPYEHMVGGIWSYTAGLSSILKKKGFKVILWGKGKKSGKPLFSFDKFHQVIDSGSNYSFLHALYKQAKSNDTDIVHAQRPDWLLPFKKGKKVITLHGSHAKNVRLKKGIFSSIVYSFLEKKALKLADGVIFVSSRDKKDYESRIKISNSYLIPPAIVLPKKIPTKKKNQFIFVGRLEPEKGLLELITKWGEEKLLIVGSGRQESQLRHAAKFKNIEFLGPKKHNEVIKLMAESKALVLNSLHEGLPITIIESLAVGTPVISTPVGDISSIINHGKNGFLLNKISLSNALVQIDGMSNECIECIKTAKSYAWESLIGRIIEVYK